MYTVKQGSRTDYNYKEIYLDSLAELAEVDVSSFCPGSVAYIIQTGTVYILNSQKEWIVQ